MRRHVSQSLSLGSGSVLGGIRFLRKSTRDSEHQSPPPRLASALMSGSEFPLKCFRNGIKWICKFHTSPLVYDVAPPLTATSPVPDQRLLVTGKTPVDRSSIADTHRTSRNPDRQTEQLKSVELMPALTSEEVDSISQAGKGWFRRHFQRGVWDAARP